MSDPARLQRPRHPSLRPTPPLSVEASEAILEEMERPPADTPERRATFERMRVIQAVVREMLDAEQAKVQNE
ncbi:MAG TPA: hypothetical protein VF746_27135 [Longimicrobium sp.]|jgi:hypothetical protein